MSVSAQDMEELRQDMLYQDFQDGQHEERMHRDIDYALQYILDNSPEHVRVSHLYSELAKYGHQLNSGDIEERLDD